MNTCTAFYDLIQQHNYMLRQQINPCTLFSIMPAISQTSTEFLTSRFSHSWKCTTTTRWHQYSTFNKADSCILITEHRKQDCPETERKKCKQHIHQQSHHGDFQILLCPWQPARLTWSPQQSVLPISPLKTHACPCW